MTFIAGRYAVSMDELLPLAWDRDGEPIFAHEPHVELQIEIGDGEEDECL